MESSKVEQRIADYIKYKENLKFRLYRSKYASSFNLTWILKQTIFERICENVGGFKNKMGFNALNPIIPDDEQYEKFKKLNKWKSKPDPRKIPAIIETSYKNFECSIYGINYRGELRYIPEIYLSKDDKIIAKLNYISDYGLENIEEAQKFIDYFLQILTQHS